MIPTTQTVCLYLHGLPSQRTAGHVLLRVERGMAVVATAYNDSGEAFYHLSDGHRCEPDGTPCSWDFWRLTADSIRAIKAARNTFDPSPAATGKETL